MSATKGCLEDIIDMKDEQIKKLEAKNADLKRRVAEYEQRGDGRSAFTNKVVDLCKDMAGALEDAVEMWTESAKDRTYDKAKQAIEKFKEVMK